MFQLRNQLSFDIAPHNLACKHSAYPTDCVPLRNQELD